MDGNNGDIYWSFGRTGCGPMEALHIESIKRSEGWNFYWDPFCDLYFDFSSMAQIQAEKRWISIGDLELE